MATVLLVERMPLSSLNSTNPAVVDMCKLLVDRGHKVMAVTMSSSEKQESMVETYTVPLPFQRQRHMLKILAGIVFSIVAPVYAAYIVKSRKVNIICYNDVVPVFWPIASFFLRNVKKVHFEGDFLTEYISKEGLGRLIYSPLFQIERWHWKQYDIVAVTSKTFLRLLVQNGVSEERVTILPESVDTDLFKPKLKRANENNSSPFALVAHGILTYYKGMDILIHAVKRVLEKGYQVHLTIIGDGPEKPVLEDLARKWKIEKAISMLGWVPLKHVPSLISDAKLGVVVRRKSLANDLVLTQALLQYACLCVPILAPSTGTIQEEMEHGKNAIIYRAGDAEDLAEKIIFAIENEHLLDKIAEDASRLINTLHNRKVVAERAADICLSLAN